MSESRSGTSAPTVLRMILGRRLQDMRLAAGASLEDAAKALRVTPLTIRRLEKAEVALKPLYVEKLLETFGADRQEIDEFVDLAEQANEPGWWHSYRDAVPSWFTAYVSLETGAQTLRTYEPQYVTGLLQTHDYARAVLRGGLPNGSDEELTRRVELRLRRQGLLEREDAPTLWVVMEEAVLHRTVGSADIMREQIERLLDVSELPMSASTSCRSTRVRTSARVPRSHTSGSRSPSCRTSSTAKSCPPPSTWTNGWTSSPILRRIPVWRC